MGAWIEIVTVATIGSEMLTSHPTMGAWIEITHKRLRVIRRRSHPTMGAWIEMR